MIDENSISYVLRGKLHHDLEEMMNSDFYESIREISDTVKIIADRVNENGQERTFRCTFLNHSSTAVMILSTW